MLAVICLCSCATARQSEVRFIGGKHLAQEASSRPVAAPPPPAEVSTRRPAGDAAQPAAAPGTTPAAPIPPTEKGRSGTAPDLRTITLNQTAAAARHPEDELYPGGMYEPPVPAGLEPAAPGPNGGPVEGEARPEEAEEITGLIVEHTMSRIGSYFYQVFFLLWEAPEGASGANIIITERLSPGWGSWIVIEIESVPVWGRILKPRNEEIEDAAAEAVQAVKEALINMQVTQQDLEGGDLEGDGI
ncbi:MAG: CsgE family curli-type amyloid fiber assembly protein [bacterium]